jgi:hypothetical protein
VSGAIIREACAEGRRRRGGAFMRREKKRLRELEHNLKSVNDKLTSKSFTHQERLDLQLKRDSYKLQIELYESDFLRRKALQLGIDIPKNPGWWNDDNDDGLMPPEAVTSWLSYKGRIGVGKLIREEKRKNIEWWVKTITPILGALISLLGLIVALVTISKK